MGENFIMSNTSTITREECVCILNSSPCDNVIFTIMRPHFPYSQDTVKRNKAVGLLEDGKDYEYQDNDYFGRISFMKEGDDKIYSLLFALSV